MTNPETSSDLVKVKRLEWQEADENEGGLWHWTAGDYGITKLDWDGFSTYDVARGHWLAAGPFKTLDLAKAGAQQDFERRILSAIDPTTIERLTAERDEARKTEAKMKREYDAWRGFYANLHIAMETDTTAEAKVRRQARLLVEQGDRIRRLRAEVRRHLGRDPYEPRALFSLRGMIRQNEINYAKFKAAESLNARQVEALRQNFCPRPCNGRPDDLSVGACIDFGECGCMNGAALATESSNG